jgi:hypothetical protein
MMAHRRFLFLFLLAAGLACFTDNHPGKPHLHAPTWPIVIETVLGPVWDPPARRANLAPRLVGEYSYHYNRNALATLCLTPRVVLTIGFNDKSCMTDPTDGNLVVLPDDWFQRAYVP